MSLSEEGVSLKPFDLVYWAENEKVICPNCKRRVWDDDLFVDDEGNVVCCEECYCEYVRKMKCLYCGKNSETPSNSVKS